MIFGAKENIALEMTRNSKGRYALSLIVKGKSYGNPKVFGDLFEANLTITRLVNNKSDFENPEVALMSSEDFFKWLCGVGINAKDANEKYLELKRRHKHTVQFGKSLMPYSIFCCLDNDMFNIYFYGKKKKIIETSVEYKYVSSMAEEFNDWSKSLIVEERKILEWSG
jgi:hypothetical protein